MLHGAAGQHDAGDSDAFFWERPTSWHAARPAKQSDGLRGDAKTRGLERSTRNVFLIAAPNVMTLQTSTAKAMPSDRCGLAHESPPSATMRQQCCGNDSLAAFPKPYDSRGSTHFGLDAAELVEW